MKKKIILFIFLILGNLLEAKTYCKVVSEFGLLKEETLTKAIQEEEKKGAEFVTITVDNETAYIIFKTHLQSNKDNKDVDAFLFLLNLV